MATKLVEFKIGDDESILVEVEEERPTGGMRPIADDSGAISQAPKRFEETLAVLKPLADAAITKLKGAVIQPDEIKIELELKISSSGSLILASSEGSASLKVGMTWRKEK
jgi:hypothetical protein